jgi:hypothetical protein
MPNDSDSPATKRDLENLERDLKRFIIDREVTSIRWFIGVFGALQVTYFFGTLAMIYFLFTHLPKP